MAGEKWKSFTAEEKKPYEEANMKAREEWTMAKKEWETEHPDYVKPAKAKKGEKGVKRKLEADSETPKAKKAPTAYALFCGDPAMRAKAAIDHPSEFAERGGAMKAMANLWKAAAPEQRALFEEKARTTGSKSFVAAADAHDDEDVEAKDEQEPEAESAAQTGEVTETEDAEEGHAMDQEEPAPSTSTQPNV